MGVRYTEEQARKAIAASLSFTEALRRLGMCWSGGNHLTLKKRVAEWSIPTDHFDPDEVRRRAVRRGAIPLADVLVEDSTYSRGRLKERLYEAGLKTPVCELCGQGERWEGRRMALILDHVNGQARDNPLLISGGSCRRPACVGPHALATCRGRTAGRVRQARP